MTRHETICNDNSSWQVDEMAGLYSTGSYVYPCDAGRM